jgi:hypothetical protein
VKLAFLGASVTAQKINHQTGDITGYAEAFRVNHCLGLGFTDAVNLAYPGNRASDGGMVRALEVRKYQPDYCIFEPNIEDFFRGSDILKDELMFIYQQIIAGGARPIALMLPDHVTLNPTTRPQYALHRSVCETLSIPMIEIDLRDVRDAASFLQNVHTTPLGAQFYAKVIADRLGEILQSTQSPLPTPESIQTKQDFIRLPKVAADRVTNIAIRIRTRNGGPARIRIVQEQKIGPFSPMICADCNGRVSHSSIWDPYCHYERKAFSILFSGPVSTDADLRIAVIDTDPAYEKCRREGIVWPVPSERYMKQVGDIFVFFDEPLQADLMSSV